ncbi:hypothetical protein O3P69_001632 [Scylla paramamosain]|uniref:Uncharacterized protein n=1 Tax=Scylla paramamosain TaxID=85552 RepID=A0AAW0V133_SCYPA
MKLTWQQRSPGVQRSSQPAGAGVSCAGAAPHTTRTTSRTTPGATRSCAYPRITMTADTDIQKTPLVEIEVQRSLPDANLMEHILNQDNEVKLQQMLQKYTLANVLRPKHKGRKAGTVLHTAVISGAEKCLKVLLSHRPSKEDLEAPDSKGQTALLTAVDNARHAELDHLLTAGANVNARDDNHRGALHLLVLNLSEDSNQVGDFLKVADLLLSSKHVNKLDLEPHANFYDATGATPLALAAAKLQKEDINLLELCKKLVKAGASLSENVNDSTVKQVLTQKECLTEKLLSERKQPPARSTAAQVVDLVCMCKTGSEVEEVLQGKRPEDAREAVRSNLGRDNLLSYAVTVMNTSMVDVLLKYGADPWLSFHSAAVKGHVEIFTMLLKKMKEGNDTIDLRDHTASLITNLMANSHIKTTQNIDHMACFRHLLQEAKLNLNQKDPDQTPLHLAAAFNQQEAMSEMLRAGAFLGARHVVCGKDCGSVLDIMLPETLEHAMDRCISHYCKDISDKTENVVSEDYTLHLDYRFLLPPKQNDTKSDSKPVNEMETLMEVCSSKRHRHLIGHPLVNTLLYAKWNKVLLLYWVNLLLYLFFVVMLTKFIYLRKDLRATEVRLSVLQDNGITNTTSLETSMQGKQNSQSVSLVLLMFPSLFMFARMALQIKFSLKYFKNVENYIQWFLLMVVPVLRFAPLEVDHLRQLSAWVMIIAWLEFVLKLGRVPFFALYITMLCQVTSNFLRLTILYIILIIAFVLSFNILLLPSGENPLFPSTQSENVSISFPKAIIMSTGEFEYSNMNENFPDGIKISADIMTLVFVFAIFLVLMNVMNALAVTDAQEVVNDTKLHSLISRLELISTIETFLNHPYIHPYLGKLKLLSGPNNTPSFLAKINLPKKHKRLLSGLRHQTPNKLNDETAECLRVHRLQCLEKMKSQQRDQVPAKLEDVVEILAGQHPHLLCSLADALRPGQQC